MSGRKGGVGIPLDARFLINGMFCSPDAMVGKMFAAKLAVEVSRFFSLVCCTQVYP